MALVLQKLKSDNYTLTEAESKQIQAVAQQRQASLAGVHPFTSGFNSNYKVLGFSNTQRALFMKVHAPVLLQLSACLTQHFMLSPPAAKRLCFHTQVTHSSATSLATRCGHLCRLLALSMLVDSQSADTLDVVWRC